MEMERRTGPWRISGFFFFFQLCCGAFAPTALFDSWHANNVLGESARAAVVGLIIVGGIECRGLGLLLLMCQLKAL